MSSFGRSELPTVVSRSLLNTEERPSKNKRNFLGCLPVTDLLGCTTVRN